MTGVGLDSIETPGYLEAIKIKLAYKAGGAGSFKAVGREKLLLHQALIDDDAITLVVPDDGINLTVVDQAPQFHREDVCIE